MTDTTRSPMEQPPPARYVLPKVKFLTVKVVDVDVRMDEHSITATSAFVRVRVLDLVDSHATVEFRRVGLMYGRPHPNDCDEVLHAHAIYGIAVVFSIRELKGIFICVSNCDAMSIDLSEMSTRINILNVSASAANVRMELHGHITGDLSVESGFRSTIVINETPYRLRQRKLRARIVFLKAWCASSIVINGETQIDLSVVVDARLDNSVVAVEQIVGTTQPTSVYKDIDSVVYLGALCGGCFECPTV